MVHVLKAIATAAPATAINPLYIGEYVFPPNSTLKTDLECPVCCDILHQPIQLSCSNVVCATCCKQWVESAVALSCPCCYNDHTFTINPPPSVLINLLGNQLITCSKCSKVVKAKEHTMHISSACKEYYQLHHHKQKYHLRRGWQVASSSACYQRARMGLPSVYPPLEG